MGMASVSDQVPPKEYTVMLDLNGLLIHWVYHRSSPKVHVRPGLMDFLVWLFSRARVLFWSSATQRNMTPLLRTVLSGTGVGPKEVTYYSQLDCTQSSYQNPEKKEKPFFLKDLATLVERREIESTDYILLIDDSPLKNLLNNPYNAIHPKTWSGEADDSFLNAFLRPWLDGLLSSNRAVPEYVKANPLRGCQTPEERLGQLACNILKGVRNTA